MKLSGITAESNPLPNQLRAIFNGHQSHLVESTIQRVKAKNFLPLSYLFIESAAATHSLNEGRFEDLFKAGLAKLNSALTPGSDKDLGMLLDLAVPDGGGAKAVADLVAAAGKEQSDITQNDNWWNGLFQVFGTDPGVRDNVREQVGQEIAGKTAAPAADAADTPAAPLADPAADPAAAPAPAPAAAPGMLGKLKNAVTGAKQGFAGSTPAAAAPAPNAVAKTQETTKQAIGHLRDKLEAGKAEAGAAGLNAEVYDNNPEKQNDAFATQVQDISPKMKGPSYTHGPKKDNKFATGVYDESKTAELIIAEIATVILNESKNTVIICNHMIRQIGIQCKCSTPVLSEAGLMDKVRGAIKGGRNFLANPQLAQRNLQGATTSANNTKAAKLAVQILSDQIRTDFESKLLAKEMTPEQIAEKYKKFTELAQIKQQSGNNPDERVIQQMTKIGLELKEIFSTFNFEQAAEVTNFEQPAAQPAAQSRPKQPDIPELNYRENIIAKVANIATDKIFDAASYEIAGRSMGLVKIMADKGPWARLAGNTRIRGKIEAKIAKGKYLNIRGKPATPENLQPKDRVSVLSSMFLGVSKTKPTPRVPAV